MRGNASLSNSSRFALSSGVKKDDPVMLPPGRARLATSPAATASPTGAMTIGIVVVACLAARAPGTAVGHDDVDLEPHQLGRELGKPVVLALRPAELDDEVLALDVAELAQARPECLQPGCDPAAEAGPRKPMRRTLADGCCAKEA